MLRIFSIVLLAVTLGSSLSWAAPPREVEVDVAAKIRPPRADASHGDVVLYGADWCPQCRRARKYLASQNIAYRLVDTETPQGKAAYKAARGRETGIPLMVVGNQMIRGFSVESYDRAFETNKKGASKKPGQKRP